MSIDKNIQKLKLAQKFVRTLPSEKKNQLLLRLAQLLEQKSEDLIKMNKKDLRALPRSTAQAFRDRLTLNSDRVAHMSESLRQVAAWPDPVDEVVEKRALKNGLFLRRVRSPIGVILMIFESRPNVIIEAFSLAFKSGNSIVLRGGSEAKHTAKKLYELIEEAAQSAQIHHPIFYGLQDYNRRWVARLLKRKDLFDLVVPRGGERLINFVQKTSLIPIIKNDRGLCHIYIDESANLEMAAEIVVNAKMQRPGVCNSLETVLIHESLLSPFLQQFVHKLDSAQLEIRADATSLVWLKKMATANIMVKRATPRDWNTEHLDFILNCRVVSSLDEALAHIESHGSKHSEAIITQNEMRAVRFQKEVDAAAVYWNASTRFTDGFEFGLGGELGISTQKLHTRGPVGLRELTSARWIIDGKGQIRT
jgi:glutamate-5-semialdehyde dehydrogenase